jgi:hypothetical protein
MIELTLEKILYVLVGGAVKFLFSIGQAAYVYYKSGKKKNALIRTWHSYHWSRLHGEPIFRHERWCIRRRIFSIHISQTDAKDPSLVYHGKVEIEGSHVLINVDGSDHDDSAFVRFPLPIPHQTEVFGLHMGQDFERHLYSTTILISRDELEPSVAKEKLRLRTIRADSDLSLRLKDSIAAKKKPAGQPNGSQIAVDPKTTLR